MAPSTLADLKVGDAIAIRFDKRDRGAPIIKTIKAVTTTCVVDDIGMEWRILDGSLNRPDSEAFACPASAKVVERAKRSDALARITQAVKVLEGDAVSVEVLDGILRTLADAALSPEAKAKLREICSRKCPL